MVELHRLECVACRSGDPSLAESKVTVDWWTHKVKGLHLNDFIMAAKIDRVYN